MILKNISNGFQEAQPGNLVSSKDLIELFNKRDEFKEDLLRIFNVSDDNLEVFQIDNAKQFLQAVLEIDSKCEKIDITTKLKDIHLVKMLEKEKAKFEVFNIDNSFLVAINKSDVLNAETRYSAKHDILDEYSLSKFANYCRDEQYDDLIEHIQDYISSKNVESDREIGLRLLYIQETEELLIRAKTSKSAYKDFGVNFSVFTALVSLGRYAKESGYSIFIDNYRVDDSYVFVSFQLSKVITVSENLQMRINLTLENNEIGDGAVRFNGICKLIYSQDGNERCVYVKPKGIKEKDKSYSVDLLTYAHRGKVGKVFEQLESLSDRISLFIEQVSEVAPRVSSIEHSNDVKNLIADKVRNSKKKEFQPYKQTILNKLTKITVDNTFKLFELLGEIELLFEHQDVISRDFWRLKLYEALIERK